MTTFTTEDRKSAEESWDWIPIPFLGWVQQKDNDDREEYLREQIHILQAECQRLRQKLMEYGCNE
jgi:hypothetical protein